MIEAILIAKDFAECVFWFTLGVFGLCLSVVLFACIALVIKGVIDNWR